jgi:GH15 family glucan-1,4-alpha-glucosidase
VRIGNAAYEQLQLDIYGEMMDAVYLANKYGHGISYAGWRDVQRLLEWLGKNWQRPDEGIWEVRGGRKEFLHSRVMCWVAFDRALRLALKRSLSGPLDVWQRTRDDIRDDIFTNFWDDELQAFVQATGTKDLDAAAMLMPLTRFTITTPKLRDHINSRPQLVPLFRRLPICRQKLRPCAQQRMACTAIPA